VAFEYLAIRPLRLSQMDVALLTFGFAPVVSQLVIKMLACPRYPCLRRGA